MIDDIFKKLYKNKRYIPVLEASNNGGKAFQTVENAYEDFKKRLPDYVVGNNNIMLAINSRRFVIYKALDNITDVVENPANIEETVKQIVQPVLKDCGITVDDNNPLKIEEFRANKGTILTICPMICMIFDTVSLRLWTTVPVFYQLGIKTVGDSFTMSIYNRLFARSYPLETVNEMIDREKQPIIDYLTVKSEVSEEDDVYYLDPPNLSNDNNPSESPYITFATTWGGSDICFRLYTSQLVSNDSPRTPENNTKMIESSILTIKKNLMSTNLDDKNKAINFSKNVLDDDIQIDEAIDDVPVKKRGRPAKNPPKNSGAYEIMTKNSGEENKLVIQRAINLCDTYYNAVDNASKGIFDKDYQYSNAANADIQVYLPELLSPYALIFNKCSWEIQGGDSGFKLLSNAIGHSGNDFSDTKCYFGYYTSSTNELTDSYVWLDGKMVDISTKGGANGKGSSASITSLKKYIYKTDINGNLTDELSPKGEILQRFYKLEFELFTYLCDNRKATAQSTAQWLRQHNVPITSSRVTAAEVSRVIEHETKMTDFIMEVLQSARFDFIQMNAKPSSTEGDFHLNFHATYPAIFSGNVEITFASTSGSGGTKFHIV